MDRAAYVKLESAVYSRTFTQGCKCCDAKQLVNQWHLTSQSAFCKKCLPPETSSQDVLQVRRGTPGDVISIKDCENTHIDVTGICRFKCNLEVVYILPREQRLCTGKENQKAPATTIEGTCKKCSAPMHQADAIYCSLQCKACSETGHIPEKACKPAAAKRKRPAVADTEPTTIMVRSSKRRRIPSRALLEAASGGPSAPNTPPNPKRQRPAPCRDSPATPYDALKEMEIQWGEPVRTFMLLRAMAVIEYLDSMAA